MKMLVSITAVSLLLLSGCGSDSKGEEASELEGLSAKEKLGQSLFFDANLSRDRKTSCATCHNPEHGFVDARFSENGVDQNIFVNGAFSVGDDGVSLGGRNAPTASYAMFSPDFSENAGVYTGGQFHDGRAASLKVQAGGPPLDGAEMQMSDKNSVVQRIKENDAYIASFESLYGADIFDDINATYESMTEAIAKFEKTDEFAPFDSKYDRWKAGTYTFSDTEEAGYALFFSNANTNCASCHTLNSSSEAISKEMFTNYAYENIGTPRNIAAMDARAALGLQDANATFSGLGGTIKSSDASWETHLGKTKVPTLRNVAVTGPYMNNGVFKELRTVLKFYDHMAGLGDNATNPETLQPWVENDHNATINHGLLQATKKLPNAKIRALEAFLRTLTDEKYEHLMGPLEN